jgi:hypothetical protein
MWQNRNRFTQRGEEINAPVQRKQAQSQKFTFLKSGCLVETENTQGILLTTNQFRQPAKL